MFQSKNQRREKDFFSKESHYISLVNNDKNGISTVVLVENHIFAYYQTVDMYI